MNARLTNLCLRWLLHRNPVSSVGHLSFRFFFVRFVYVFSLLFLFFICASNLFFLFCRWKQGRVWQEAVTGYFESAGGMRASHRSHNSPRWFWRQSISNYCWSTRSICGRTHGDLSWSVWTLVVGAFCIVYSNLWLQKFQFRIDSSSACSNTVRAVFLLVSMFTSL